jgi:hypothetical protein
VRDRDAGHTRRQERSGGDLAVPILALAEVALKRITDSSRTSYRVRKVPTGDSCTAALLGLFDHLVGVEQEVVGDDEAQSLRHLEIDD